MFINSTGAEWCNSCADMGSATNLHLRSCQMRAGEGIRRISPSFVTRRVSTGGRPNFCALAGGSPPPWLMLAPAIDVSGDSAYEFYSLTNKTAFQLRKNGEGVTNPPPDDCTILGSAHGWLILSDFRSSDLYLSDPVSHRHIKLPSLERFADGSGEMRVILTSSPDDHESLVILSFLPEHRLVYCSPGRSCVWTPMAPSESDEIAKARETNFYKEFAYSRGQKLLYCLTDWFIDVWDLAVTGNPRVDWMAEAFQFEPQQKIYTRDWILKYLVLDQGSDALYLVARYVNPRMDSDGSYVSPIFFSKYRGWDSSYPYKTIDFEVYKVDFMGGGEVKLSYMEDSLNGMAMFVGKKDSFAVSASNHPELNPNSIYFVDDDMLSYEKYMWNEEDMGGEIVWTDYGGHDNGVFDYAKKRFSSLCDLCPFDYQSIKRISPPPLWFAPSS